jgi:ATP-dependent 26S proteasome regulatory subunit
MEEFVAGQERLKPQEDKNKEDRSKVDDLRRSPMNMGNLEEIIYENHAIVSSSVGPEYYVNVLSFVDKDQLEPGCAILMHNKVFFSFYLVHITLEKEQWWPDMFACTFLSLPFCCYNCVGSCPHDGQPKRLGAMESSISSAISSSFPIEGGGLSRMLFTGR